MNTKRIVTIGKHLKNLTGSNGFRATSNTHDVIISGFTFNNINKLGEELIEIIQGPSEEKIKLKGKKCSYCNKKANHISCDGDFMCDSHYETPICCLPKKKNQKR